jgi:molybdopterin synthase catalytic subunit/molybdopterin converting factor small subunit
MITVRLFGMMRSLANNQSNLTVSLNGRRQVSELVAILRQSHPQIGELLQKKKVLVSVNQEIAHDETVIQDGDEVALLPPFAGGTSADRGDDEGETRLVRVQRENFSVDQELNDVRRRSRRIGGMAMFLGTARDRSQGHDVSRITFEHYEGMAQKKLREIRDRALKDFDVLEVLILHRYGPIDIGENIVLIIVGAEHRADAFRACKWCIDELKQIAPIWKLEQTPDGEVWVEEHP